MSLDSSAPRMRFIDWEQIVRFAGATRRFQPDPPRRSFALAAGPHAPGVRDGTDSGSVLLLCAIHGREWLGPRNIVGYGVRFRDKCGPGIRLVLERRGSPRRLDRYCAHAADDRR